LPAEYCTGSSIMPQKRNPDVLETVKRKAKRIAGESSIIADIGKGNISGYSRDTQETKYCIMNIFQELEGTLDIMSDMIKGIKVSEERAKELLEKGGAYTAAEVIKEAIEKKEPYRSAKLEKERELKK
ncbi:MAG TPA: lyase family protein, partial [archaeon]|nr:lyase family protein [archaeon]